MKIYEVRNRKIVSQKTLPEGLYDVLDEQAVNDYNDYVNEEPFFSDYKNENPENLSVVKEDEIPEFLADNHVEEDQPIAEQMVEEVVPEEEDVPEFANTQDELDWAIKENRVLKIDYLTQGKRKSRGRKLKREIGLPVGASITRIIEPHYMYQAGNGNLIVVTFDRSVREIRSFIVKNIQNVTVSDKKFKQRMRIMPKSTIRMTSMKNTSNKLSKIASTLKARGLIKSADIVHDSIKTLKEVKTAQYVGAQGYWLRNRRCWDNCYRQKRTTEPNKAAQEVWMDCWDEYLKAINNNDSGWEKYASRGGDGIKLGKNEISAWNRSFANKVGERRKEGNSLPESIYITIEEESQKLGERIIDECVSLSSLGSSLVESGFPEVGQELTDASAEMLKEAQFKGNNQGSWLRGLGTPFENAGKAIGRWWTGKGKKSDIVKKIQDVIDRANKMLNTLNMGAEMANPQAVASPQQASPQQAAPQQAVTSSRTIVIEAGKGTRVEKVTQRWDQRGERGRFAPAVPAVAPAVAPAAPAAAPAAPAAPPAAPAAASAAAPAAPVSTSVYGDINREYSNFVKDVSGLVKDLTGFATKTQDPEISSYIQGAIPLLQGFIGKGSELRTLSKGQEQREFVRTSLQDLSTNLQGVVSGANASSDLGLGDAGGQASSDAGQAAGAGVSPGVGRGEGQGIGDQGTRGIDPKILDLISQLPNNLQTLIPIKTFVDKKINQLSAAASSTKEVK